MMNDYDDPEINRVLWLCAEALGDVTTTTLVFFYNEEDIATPNPFLLDCNS